MFRPNTADAVLARGTATWQVGQRSWCSDAGLFCDINHLNKLQAFAFGPLTGGYLFLVLLGLLAKSDMKMLQASGFGPLTGGYLFSVPTSQARALLGSPRPAVLTALGGKTCCPFTKQTEQQVEANCAAPRSPLCAPH